MRFIIHIFVADIKTCSSRKRTIHGVPFCLDELDSDTAGGQEARYLNPAQSNSSLTHEKHAMATHTSLLRKHSSTHLPHSKSSLRSCSIVNQTPFHSPGLDTIG